MREPGVAESSIHDFDYVDSCEVHRADVEVYLHGDSWRQKRIKKYLNSGACSETMQWHKRYAAYSSLIERLKDPALAHLNEQVEAELQKLECCCVQRKNCTCPYRGAYVNKQDPSNLRFASADVQVIIRYLAGFAYPEQITGIHPRLISWAINNNIYCWPALKKTTLANGGKHLDLFCEVVKDAPFLAPCYINTWQVEQDITPAQWTKLLLALPQHDFILSQLAPDVADHFVAVCTHDHRHRVYRTGDDESEGAMRRLDARRTLALISGLADGYLVLRKTDSSASRFMRLAARLPFDVQQIIACAFYGVPPHTIKVEAIDIWWMARWQLVQ